jgi:hypothetical protein
MKSLEPFKFDYQKGIQELEEFDKLLSSRDELGERDDILPFFRKRRHLSAFLGALNPNIINFNRLAFELYLMGSFSCDLAIGDSESGSYCLFEFEDAKENSVFKKHRTKSTPEWSSRFDHGFSQVIDWLWLLDDFKQTGQFRKLFGAHEINFTAYLIVGRSKYIDDENRFRWRQNKVLVNSHKIHCFTFDELLIALKRKNSFYKSIYNDDAA